MTDPLSPPRHDALTWVAGSDAPEKSSINLGFLPLTDAASLIVAATQGFAQPFGLTLNLQRQNSWSALRDKLIGASIGTSYGNVFDAAVADGTLTIVGFNDTRSGLAMLMRERIDAILIGSSVDLKRLGQDMPELQGAAFATLPVPFKTDSKYLGISVALKMGWFVQRFNQCLARGYSSGAFDAIIYQYSN